MPKPRRFNHKNIYADDRKQWLGQIEERARLELQQSSAGKMALRERIHSSMTKNMYHLPRKRSRSNFGCLVTNIGLVVIILFVLFVAWRIILSI